MNNIVAQSGYLFRLALIIDGVYRAVAAHIARDRTAGPTIVLVCNDVRRRFFRFARLVELVQLGILPRTRLPAASWTRASRPASERAPYTRLPRGKGFLVKMMQQAPWTVAVYASQMHYWMEDPGVLSFLTSYPQGRRILRPVWRLLSADPLPPALREPTRADAPADAGSAACSVPMPDMAAPEPGSGGPTFDVLATARARAAREWVPQQPVSTEVAVSYRGDADGSMVLAGTVTPEPPADVVAPSADPARIEAPDGSRMPHGGTAPTGATRRSSH